MKVAAKATPISRQRRYEKRGVLPSLAPVDVENLRVENLLVDRVTGLTIHPLLDLKSERHARLGVVYLQIGRFSGVESLYGWQLYDKILALASESIRVDMEASPLRSGLVGILFTGADGFYVVLDLPAREHSRLGSMLEEEAARLRDGIVRRLSKSLGRTTVDLLTVHASALRVTDDPRVRPSRNVLRALSETARLVGVRETRERRGLIARFREIIVSRDVRPYFQPVVELKTGKILGYEALIRGPLGTEMEAPDVLFAAAREGGLEIELENLCIERIFENLPKATRGKTLFVNASARLLAHSVFLDERNLAHLRKTHPDLVIEISEKEVVWDYASFRDVLDRIRALGFEVAIDDAGSGYSGLESILQIRPRFIKVAESIVRGLQSDPIKREIILALQSLARQIDAQVVAEAIEHEEERQSLIAVGVVYGQGYLLGRPSAKPT